MNDRAAILRDLIVAGIRAGWKMPELITHTAKLADLILGPAPAITPEVAAALDRALNGSAVPPAEDKAGATCLPDPEAAPATNSSPTSGGGKWA